MYMYQHFNIGAMSVNIKDTPEIPTTLAVGFFIGIDVHDTGKNLNFHLQKKVTYACWSIALVLISITLLNMSNKL
jgi:hypothetical protein